MANIADVIAQGKEFGIFEFYLPYIIMFAIFFGILRKVKIFGDETDGTAKGINVLLSAAMSFFVMIYTPVGTTLSQFFATIFGETLVAIISIIAVFLIGTILIKGLGIDRFAKKDDKGKWDVNKSGVVLAVIVALIGLAIFISSNGLAFFPGLTFGQLPSVSTPSVFLPSLPGIPTISSQDLAIIILVIGTVAIMMWMMKGPNENTEEIDETTGKPKKK